MPIEITKTNFQQEVLQAKSPVLVDFWAPWCGPCRMVAPVMEELAEDLKGKVAVAKINVDDEGELAAQFRVMSIPTVILFVNGQAVAKAIGARPKTDYIKMIEEHYA